MDSFVSRQNQRLQALEQKGITIVDPRQTFVADDVDLSRIHGPAVFYPGTRLSGSRTLLCPGTTIGREGPVVLINAALGEGVTVASGFVEDSVLLAAANIGANSHLRPGCLLEEQVKTAHCVGLKQTILLSYVTLGSLINFCDVLMAGGTSRKDHSEVGSGYIHFNFTPWGKHGGKATPSLIGDVEAGVLLRSPRVFLGGSGGLVGPRTVGYGSVVAAGQVVREDVPPARTVLRPPVAVDKPVVPLASGKVASLRRRNIEYLAQLMTLRLWYRAVRLPRATGPGLRELTEAALRNLDFCIAERIQLANSLFEENGVEPLRIAGLEEPLTPPLPLDPGDPATPHIRWMQQLSDPQLAAAATWLALAADAFRNSIR